MITDDMITEARARDVFRLFAHRSYCPAVPGTSIQLKNTIRRFRFQAAERERAVARIWIRHAPGQQYHYADNGDIRAEPPFCTRKHISVMAIADPEYFAAQVRCIDVITADIVAGRAGLWTGSRQDLVHEMLHGSPYIDPSAEEIDAARDQGRRRVDYDSMMRTFRALGRMLPWVRQAALDIAALDAAYAASVRTEPVDVPLSEEDQEDLDAITNAYW